jgi:Zn-dependent peptidase ImmA (M78 family)
MAKWIETRARQILRETQTLRIPVPVDLIAHRLGLEVEGAALGHDVSGVLVVRGGKGLIGYNQADAPVRQRFTIAHEIAHYILHGTEDSGVFIDKGYTAVFKRDGKSTKGEHLREIQANQFAAALLMPADLVRNAVRALRFDFSDERALKELANQFGVSTLAMSLRLANLEIFQSAT